MPSAATSKTKQREFAGFAEEPMDAAAILRLHTKAALLATRETDVSAGVVVRSEWESRVRAHAKGFRIREFHMDALWGAHAEQLVSAMKLEFGMAKIEFRNNRQVVQGYYIIRADVAKRRGLSSADSERAYFDE